ncbi:hypothetical protein OPT61_g3207 [Boeremia exigua]|uniref:Uncharacterized protein n=1 Tax=Boeremia exigua TaxID=749465 RepID=A0ACC2IIU2_9PLEO|nr:hypothetical protein OPT61_g3207 [Boeremia exigua]
MAAAIEPKTALILRAELATKSRSVPSEDIKVDITRSPTEDTEDATSVSAQDTRTLLHIYFQSDCGSKSITPTLSPSQERRWGPTPKEQKARRAAKKAAKKLRSASRLCPTPTTPVESAALPISTGPAEATGDSYFMHTPYLSFHVPPSVLYVGTDRYSPSIPVALVTSGCFWRAYRIQLGRALSLPGVIDPRGVVSWRHNGGSKTVLRDNDRNGDGRLLKGYKVRGWRLWGETGKSYVHTIRNQRKAGQLFDDPDNNDKSDNRTTRHKVRADEVVHLTWTRPLSRHTRLYSFKFRGIEFQWKGTGTVSEGRECGWMLRFCHLKLVAKIPINVESEKEEGTREVCLGKYTSSVAAEKSGTLTVFDQVVVRFAMEWMPSLIEEEMQGAEKTGSLDCNAEENQVSNLKRGSLYQLIVATVLCMASAEKEKRHTLMDLVIGILENAGNGGG